MKLDKKNITLLVGIVITLIIVYNFALSNTITQHSTYQELKNSSLMESTAIRQRIILEKKNKVLDSILSMHNITSGSKQNQLLNVLNMDADSLGFNIISFSEPHRLITDQITTKTFMFVLEGEYVNILKSLYRLEKNYAFGEIVHVSLEKKIDNRTKKERLEVRCFLALNEIK